MGKKITCLGFVILAVLGSKVWGGTYSGGIGEPNNPYRIFDANDMNEIGANPEDWDKHFVMVNDVNLASYTGIEFNIIGVNIQNPFSGVFDGNGFKIYNFTYDSNGAENTGIFGYVYGFDSEIKNLGLVNCNVNAGTYGSCGGLVGVLEKGSVINCYSSGRICGTDYSTGGLIGSNSSGIISNCYSTGEISTDSRCVGGLVGNNNYGGTITNCHSDVNVSGIVGVGGLVGSNNDSNITECQSSGEISGEDSLGGLVGENLGGTISNCCSASKIDGNDYVIGGLVGYNDASGKISNCYSSGDVWGGRNVGGLVGINYFDCTISECYSSGDVNGTQWVGGLVGGNYEAISNCYSKGDVIGDDDVGGLVGWNGLGIISDCYASGSVSGRTDVGGLLGFHHSGYYIKCFWDSDISPNMNGIGNITDPNVIGKSTAEMQKESTFTDAGWDFVEIWNIGENQMYPYLRVYPAGDLNHDRRVDFFDFAILSLHWLEGD